VSAGVLLPLGLVAVAESLRAAGFEAEIYDAMASSFGAESIRLYIEHSLPHVVVAGAYAATAETARDVLRTAKEVVPGVFTVLLGAQLASAVAKAAKDAAVDCVVGDNGAETLPGLLARLRAGEQPRQIAQSRAA
jgi:methylmalonyl-CoA mutase cobalamin-binding subunit